MDYTLRSSGALQPVAFEDRAEPVRAAIEAGTFDTPGTNFTRFAPKKKGEGDAPRRPVTRLGTM